MTGGQLVCLNCRCFRFSNLKKNVHNTGSYRQSGSILSDDLTGRSKSTCVRNIIEKNRVHIHWKTRLNSSHNYLRTPAQYFHSKRLIHFKKRTLIIKKTKRHKFSLVEYASLTTVECPKIYIGQAELDSQQGLRNVHILSKQLTQL